MNTMLLLACTERVNVPMLIALHFKIHPKLQRVLFTGDELATVITMPKRVYKHQSCIFKNGICGNK